MSHITCYNGEKLSLTTGVPTMHSAGVQLGRITRFCGALGEFYPVLAHTIVVGHLLPDKIRIYGFLHDVPEMALSDVPTPMKTDVARNREARILARVYAELGIKPPSENTMDYVHEADEKALYAEAIILGHKGDWGTTCDPMAATLTRKWRKKSIEMLNADYAGPLFERKVAQAIRLNAG